MVSKTISPVEVDPSELLPRDATGSYLHLKLKRFPSIKDLTMPYAKKTWQQMPHDVQVEISPNGRAMCRQCHSKIGKGDIRFQLALQCHKGCRMAAFFHSDCVWEYPEATKIVTEEEIVGLNDLPSKDKKVVLEQFEDFVKSHSGGDKDTNKIITTKNRKKKAAKADTSTKAAKKAKRSK
ncbi:MAG: hypothetical protein SGARI_007049 [Bacillariaceae sp.]